MKRPVVLEVIEVLKPVFVVCISRGRFLPRQADQVGLIGGSGATIPLKDLWILLPFPILLFVSHEFYKWRKRKQREMPEKKSAQSV